MSRIASRAAARLDVRLEVWQVALLEVVEDLVPVARTLLAPVHRRVAEVGHRRQHVEGLAAVRRHRRVGQGRGVEVEREVVGQAPPAGVDTAEDLARVAAELNG